MEPNIVFSHVTKTYKGGVTALEDVSFSVGSGVFGLLGHNGAGKSTLMKALVTVEPPNSGAIQVCGFDTVRQGREVRRRLGYLPQELPMYPSLSVRDFLRYMGELKGLRDKSQVENVLAQVEMQDFARRKIGQLSGGMRRRVGIAQALLGEPPVLVVDEPTAGLDPEERVRFQNVVAARRRKGVTLISTHIVGDVEALCGTILILHQGKLAAVGTAQEIAQLAQGKVYAVPGERESELRGSFFVKNRSEENGASILRVLSPEPQPGEPLAPTMEDGYLCAIKGF